jgi:hypothetical protein
MSNPLFVLLQPINNIPIQNLHVKEIDHNFHISAIDPFDGFKGILIIVQKVAGGRVVIDGLNNSHDSFSFQEFRGEFQIFQVGFVVEFGGLTVDLPSHDVDPGILKFSKNGGFL